MQLVNKVGEAGERRLYYLKHFEIVRREHGEHCSREKIV